MAATSGLGIERHLSLLPLPVLLENVAGVYAPMLAGATCCVPPLAEVGLSGATAFDPRACLAAIERWQAHSVILLPQMMIALTAALESGRASAVAAPLRRGRRGQGRAVAPRARAIGRPAGVRGLRPLGVRIGRRAERPGRGPSGQRRSPAAARRRAHRRRRRDPGLARGVPRLPRRREDRPAARRGCRTGDLGRLDAAGFLHVEGRRKHLLITSFGRNVAPEWPEAELLAGPAIAQAAVFGDARPRLCAVVVPRTPAVPDAAIEAEVRAANRRLPDYAQVAFWIRADAPFSAEDGARHGERPHPRAMPSGRATARVWTPAIKPNPESESMSFFEQLQQRTAGARAELFAIPVIRECLAGRVTREQYLAFLAQAYHHVKHTVPLLMACGSRVPEAHGWLRTAHRRVHRRGGRPRGVDPQRHRRERRRSPMRCARGAPAPATELMVAYVYDYIARRNPVGFFGMVHVLEGTSTALATTRRAVDPERARPAARGVHAT